MKNLLKKIQNRLGLIFIREKMKTDSNAFLSNYEKIYGAGHLPPGKSVPYFTAGEIFELTFLEKFRKVLMGIPGKSAGDLIRKFLVEVPLIKVTFSDQHTIVSYSQSEPDVCHGVKDVSKETVEIIQQAKLIALNRCGKELGLTGTHEFTMGSIRYKLPHGKRMDPLWWHRDLASWSMVIMTDDPNDDNGWEGGDIELAPIKMVTDGLKTKDEPVAEQAVVLRHLFNSAIFFNNYGTLHRVVALEGRHKPGTPEPKEPVSYRTIWTVFVMDKNVTWSP